MFDKKCLRLGLITMCIAMAASMLPGLYVYFRYGIIPTGEQMGQILSMLAASFLVGWIVQPLTFYPAMGVGASCMSWTSGNVAGLRMPCISAGQKSAGVEPGTPEGNVVSTMSAAMSTFVVVIILTLATLLGASVLGVLPASVTNAFAYISPSVFGAIIVNYAMSNLKQNLPLIIAGIAVYIILQPLGVSSVWATLIVLISGMFVSRGVYTVQSGKKKDKTVMPAGDAKASN